MLGLETGLAPCVLEVYRMSSPGGEGGSSSSHSTEWEESETIFTCCRDRLLKVAPPFSHPLLGTFRVLRRKAEYRQIAQDNQPTLVTSSQQAATLFLLKALPLAMLFSS